MKKIKLYNRYNTDIYLEYISENWYKLQGDLSFCRIGYASKDVIDFIDPSGGPFMQVGSFTIDNKTLQEIKPVETGGFILKLT